MNAKLLSALTVFLLIGFVTTTAYSEDAKPAAESHDQHHPDAKTAPKADTGAMGDQGGMMGKMDMGQMHSMMNECMSMHGSDGFKVPCFESDDGPIGATNDGLKRGRET